MPVTATLDVPGFSHISPIPDPEVLEARLAPMRYFFDQLPAGRRKDELEELLSTGVEHPEFDLQHHQLFDIVLRHTATACWIMARDKEVAVGNEAKAVATALCQRAFHWSYVLIDSDFTMATLRELRADVQQNIGVEMKPVNIGLCIYAMASVIAEYGVTIVESDVAA